MAHSSAAPVKYTLRGARFVRPSTLPLRSATLTLRVGLVFFVLAGARAIICMPWPRADDDDDGCRRMAESLIGAKAKPSATGRKAASKHSLSSSILYSVEL